MSITKELLEALRKSGSEISVFDASVSEADGTTFAMVSVGGKTRLAVAGKQGCARGFEVESEVKAGAQALSVCPLSHQNTEALRKALPFTAPSSLSDKAATVGVGDRLGVAGFGHIAAFRKFEASPVFAQQSVRELTLTSRTYEDVLDASTWAVFREGFREKWGADGDHLKTEDWVRKSLSIGYTMITADVSDFIRGEHAAKGESEISAAYESLDKGYRTRMEERYLGKSFPLDGGEGLRFSKVDLQMTVLVYREAIEHAARLYRAGAEALRGKGRFDFELSVDETATPTTPHAHYFVAREAEVAGIKLSSVAPRFVGEFQKGVDYIGDIQEFERTFAVHAAIARTLGYRVSVHSGSDKFSVFPAIGRISQGRFHLKTAGTSWLEALRVIAAVDPEFFRSLYVHALAGFEKARTLYHVTTDLSVLPEPKGLTAPGLRGLLDENNARQVMHITYGELLADPKLHEGIFRTLEEHSADYRADLESHIGRHLRTLGVRERPK